MKKYVTISLVIFGIILIILITAGLNTGNKTTTASNSAPATVPTKTNKKITATLALTTAELTKHNSAQSCWLLISGKIYDVTSFLGQHPGGINTILPNCGTDATVAFDTKGGRGSHSQRANAMLISYYLGNLNQTININ